MYRRPWVSITSVAKSPISMFVATGFGVGRVPKAPGTAGSVLGLFLWAPAGFLSLGAYGLWLVAALSVGIVVAGRAAEVLQRVDPPMVVWDEVVGMGVTLFGAPRTVWSLLLGFALFRLFDIAKPPPIRWLERLPEGYGIMLDDVLAGVYAGACLEGTLWIVSHW